MQARAEELGIEESSLTGEIFAKQVLKEREELSKKSSIELDLSKISIDPQVNQFINKEEDETADMTDEEKVSASEANEAKRSEAKQSRRATSTSTSYYYYQANNPLYSLLLLARRRRNLTRFSS